MGFIMRESFPSCFGQHGIQDASRSSRIPHNLVTCLYQTKLAGCCRLVSITWSRSLMGHGLSVSVDDPPCQFTCKVDIRPWLFWKRQGSKGFDIAGKKVEVFWDLASAKYNCSAEPQEGFYVAILYFQEIVLLLGDMQKEAMKRTRAVPNPIEATILSRKEHVFGKKFYTAKAQFDGRGPTHDIAIECCTEEPCLYVKIDRQVVLQVKHLIWKFRGNQTILVDGLAIELFWDVHNWFFNPSDGLAVFMFQTCLSNDKPWLRETEVSSLSLLRGPATRSFKDTRKQHCLMDSSCASVLQWPKTHSCRETEPSENTVGFSLLLYAWKNE